MFIKKQRHASNNYLFKEKKTSHESNGIYVIILVENKSLHSYYILRPLLNVTKLKQKKKKYGNKMDLFITNREFLKIFAVTQWIASIVFKQIIHFQVSANKRSKRFHLFVECVVSLYLAVFVFSAKYWQLCCSTMINNTTLTQAQVLHIGIHTNSDRTHIHTGPC